MFDVEEFIASCQAALKEHTPELAVKELVATATAAPTEIEAALGTPSEGGIRTLHRSNELTVLNIIWPPGMVLYPHDHNLWAVIGLYGGQEDNTFYNRDTKGSGLVRAGQKQLHAQDTVILEQDAIHAVANPKQAYTGAIHVYGGDFFAVARSQWESESADETPYSVEQAMQAFSDANERWLAEKARSG